LKIGTRCAERKAGGEKRIRRLETWRTLGIAKDGTFKILEVKELYGATDYKERVFGQCYIGFGEGGKIGRERAQNWFDRKPEGCFPRGAG